MKKIIIILVAVIMTGTSCATAAERNLNNATQASADASFAFDTATRNFTIAVDEFRRAIIRFEFAIEDLASADNNSDAVRARDTAFHSSRSVRQAREEAVNAHENASQAYDDSILTGIEFNRAQHDLLISSDFWGTNSGTRRNAIQAHNISVSTHNAALSQFESTRRSFFSLLDAHTQLLGSHLNALQAHNLASMPDDVLAFLSLMMEQLEEDDIEFMLEHFYTIIDILLEVME